MQSFFSRWRPGRLNFVLWAALWAVAGWGCRSKPAAGGKPGTGVVSRLPEAEWAEWQKHRLNSIAGTNGWTTVVGLFWLREGGQTLGPDQTNGVVLPGAGGPSSWGELLRAGKHVELRPAPGVEGLVNGKPLGLAPVTLRSDENLQDPDVLDIGGRRMFVIDREGRIGLRVKNPEAAARREFHGLQWYPYQPRWRVPARLIRYQPPRELPLLDVTGAIAPETSPGAVVFTWEGKEHRLETVEDKETHDLFIIFSDQTAGKTTYGAGRFLHAPHADADDRTVLDFNLAYNPPCAFTAYATCPRPPRENRLQIAIEAGEKRYQGGH